jgi:hypothetical protein
MVILESELARAVVVTVAGTRWPELTPDVAAIHEKLALSRFDFSIRDTEPADFLILCRSLDVRNAIVNHRRVVTSQFTLLFSPWSRRNNAQPAEMVMLAELEICGIPLHAWEQRTAEALLHGSGVVESVDASTMNRYDMSCFKLTAWTHSVEAIPTVRWLAVPEPETTGSLQVSAARRRPRYVAPSMLWYRVRFWFTGVLHTDPPSSSAPQSPPPPPPSPRPSVDQGTSDSAGNGTGAPPSKRQRRRRGRRHHRARDRPGRRPLMAKAMSS